MIFDAARTSYDPDIANYSYEEASIQEARKFYDTLQTMEFILKNGTEDTINFFFFFFAKQAEQVSYIMYPGAKTQRSD